jgi:hypothetical protein
MKKKNISRKGNIRVSQKTIVELENHGDSSFESLDLPLEELIEALNDPKKGEALIKAKGWSKQDLVNRAGTLINSLANSVQDVNVV